MNVRPTEIGMSRLTGQANEEPAAVSPEPAIPKTLPQPLTGDLVEALRQDIINELHHCFDPEIPVNIFELGLIYDIGVQPTGAVEIKMTLTSPACPVAGSLPGDVKARLYKLANVTAVKVDVVWEPPWDKDRMSEAAKLQLGIDD
jgi:FeS assembly SUF system protein